MHTALRRGVGVAVAAGGFVLLGFATADTATADTGERSRVLLPGTTSGQHSPDSGRGDTSGEDLMSTTAEASVPGAVDAGLGLTVTDRATGPSLPPAGLVLLGLLCLGGAVRGRTVRT